MVRNRDHARQLVRTHLEAGKLGLPKPVKRWMVRQTRYEFVAGSRVAVQVRATEHDVWMIGLYPEQNP